MNVDEAIEIATSTAITLTKSEMAEVAEVLAREVERLRAELAQCQSILDGTRTELSICQTFHCIAKKEWQLKVEKVNRLEAQLAAAKAASECPVELVALGDAEKDWWHCDVNVKCKSGEDADRLYNWLRERTKDTTPPETKPGEDLFH